MAPLMPRKILFVILTAASTCVIAAAGDALGKGLAEPGDSVRETPTQSDSLMHAEIDR